MKKFSILLSLLFFSLSVSAQQESPDWQAVEKVFSRKGTVQDDVFKITFPRSDLKVKVGDVSIEPGLALTSWIAFKHVGSRSIILGDLVLLQEEVAPVMKKFVKAGIQVTGLHNHIIGESPRVMYMHYSAQGDAAELAEAMKDALALTNTPVTPPEPDHLSSTIDWSKIQSVFGWTGHKKGNLLQVSIPRAETIKENDGIIPPSMGVATSINFQMAGEKAATTGDFVLIASEVNPVVKALADHGIAVTAIHNHMLSESPRLFFLHFWAVGKQETLAYGRRAALDKINISTKK
jgi:hypothetical protein